MNTHLLWNICKIAYIYKYLGSLSQILIQWKWFKCTETMLRLCTGLVGMINSKHVFVVRCWVKCPWRRKSYTSTIAKTIGFLYGQWMRTRKSRLVKYCTFLYNDLLPVICKNDKHLVTLYNVIFSNMTSILSNLSYISY